MNRPPAFQFYPDKWISHTRHLSDSEYRVFHEIMCWMWEHAADFCSIPDNAEHIARLLGCTCERIANALPTLCDPEMPLLMRSHGRLVCKGLKKEAEKQRAKREKSTSSANARWNKDLDPCERIANAMPTLCSPSPSPSLDQDTDSSNEESGGSAGALPASADKKAAARKTKSRAGAAASPAFAEFLDAYNAAAERAGFAKASGLRVREAAFTARCRDARPLITGETWELSWRAALARAEASPFCRGEVPPRDASSKPFRMTMDYFLRPRIVAELLEGKYDERKHTNTPGSCVRTTDESLF